MCIIFYVGQVYKAVILKHLNSNAHYVHQEKKN